MGKIKDKFSFSLFLSLLIHALLFSVIYLAGLDAKEQIKPVNEPITISLKDAKSNTDKEPKLPTKQESKPQKQTKQQSTRPHLAQPILPPSSSSPNTSEAKPQPQKTEEAKNEQPQNRPLPTTQKTDDSEQEIKKYLSKIRKKLQENLEYPHFAKKAGLQGVATVHFCIYADGGLKTGSLKITKSSGYAALDTKALETVRNSSPFAPPPSGEMELSIPVSFLLADS